MSAPTREAVELRAAALACYQEACEAAARNPETDCDTIPSYGVAAVLDLLVPLACAPAPTAAERAAHDNGHTAQAEEAYRLAVLIDGKRVASVNGAITLSAETASDIQAALEDAASEHRLRAVEGVEPNTPWEWPPETPEILALNRHIIHLTQRPPRPDESAPWVMYQRLLAAVLAASGEGGGSEELREAIYNTLFRAVEEHQGEYIYECATDAVLSLITAEIAQVRAAALAEAAALLRRRGESKWTDGNMAAWNECEQCAVALERRIELPAATPAATTQERSE